VKNLNYQITGEDLYDLFGRYGSIRQIRIGNEAKTKGTAFVVFEDVMDVRAECYHQWLSPLTSSFTLGKKCARASQWFPSPGTLHCRPLSYAGKTRCSGC
jgi:hypothetical protein